MVPRDPWRVDIVTSLAPFVAAAYPMSKPDRRNLPVACKEEAAEGPFAAEPSSASKVVRRSGLFIRSAQVRAYDDRAYCRNVGIPYKRAYALSSYALTYVALSFMLGSDPRQ